MWHEAVQFDEAAASARVSDGDATRHSEGLEWASDLDRYGDQVKRALDVILAALGLSLSSPLWVLIALAIKLEDRGPILYRQDRVGKRGKVFQVLKFRSMVPDAEEALGPVQASHQDPRVTQVGQILRATSPATRSSGTMSCTCTAAHSGWISG
jgi:lipopolysaccharide/colanic/teichoic acid biosynthesis glycosyltransferase